jgi:2-hydroxy-6-oxonona-2,4-dienedioate hydrolase
LANFLRRAELGKMTPKKNEAIHLAARLPGVNVPALIVHGRDDRIVPLEASLRVLSVLPQSQLLIFNRCGHWAQIEHSTIFNSMVRSFLKDDGVSPLAPV